MPCYDQSCTASDLVNIPSLVLSDTFNTWFDRTNQLINVANAINVFDVGVGPTDGGLRLERGCSGSFYNGIAVFYVNPGAGIGVGTEAFINNYNKVVIDATRLQDLGGNTATNPEVDDYFIISDKSDTRQSESGTPKRVLAKRMLPNTVEFGDSGDGTFTIQGNLTVIGNMNVQGTDSFIDSNDLRIEDKMIELAYGRYAEITVLDDGSGTLTAGSFAAGMTAYYVDDNGDGNENAPVPDEENATTIGTIFSWAIGETGVSGTVRISSFTVGGVNDFAASGNLVVTGGGYVGVLNVTGPLGIGDYFLNDDVLQPAGIVIKGAEGDKTFLWVCNAPQGAENWNAFVANKNLGVSGPGNWILSSKFASYGYSDSTVDNTFTYLGQGDSYTKYSVGSQLVMEHNPTGNPAIGATFGIVNMGSTGPNILPNVPVYDWVKYFNADQLDGAHASTGSVPWTIPILGADGRLGGDLVGADAIRKTFTVNGHTFSKGDIVRIDAAGSLTFASASTIPTAEAIGMVETINDDKISVVTKGFIYNLDTGTRLNSILPLATGNVYFLSPTTPGGLIDSADAGIGIDTNEVRKAMFLAAGSNSGYVLNYTGVVLGEAIDTVYMSTFAPVGAIQPYAGAANKIPLNWLLCDGRALEMNFNSELYDIVGQSYYANAVKTSVANQIIVEGDTRGLLAGDNVRIQWETNSGLSQVTGVVTLVNGSTRAITVGIIESALEFNALPTNTPVRLYGRVDSANRSIFFIPDLRSRSPFGASVGAGIAGSGNVIPELELGDMGGTNLIQFGQVVQAAIDSIGRGSATPTQEFMPPYTSMNWIIRARKGADATILTGHNHDLFYIRYNTDHSLSGGAANDLTLNNRNQFRSNARVLGDGTDGPDTFMNDFRVTGILNVNSIAEVGSLNVLSNAQFGSNTIGTIFNVRGGTGAIASIQAPLQYGVTGTTSERINDFNPLNRPVRYHSYRDMDHAGNDSTGFVNSDDWLTARGREGRTTSVVPLTIDTATGELSCTPMYRVASALPTFGQRSRLPQGFIWIVQTPGNQNNKAYIKVMDGSAAGTMVQMSTNPPAAPDPIPSGCIVMWSGTITSIPSGWSLCDGTNNTPDLRNKFIIGATGSNLGDGAGTNITGSLTKVGGTKDAMLPAHRHNFVTDDNLGGANPNDVGGFGVQRVSQISGGGSEGGGDLWSYRTSLPRRVDANGNVITGDPVAGTNEGTGTNMNLPPYYSLAYIMKNF